MKQSRLTPLLVGVCPLDWEQVFIDEVTDLLTNGYVGPSLPHQTEDVLTGVRYLQGFNVRPNKIDLERKTWVTQEFHKKNKKSHLRAGDLLVVQSGHIGTAAVVSQEAVGSNCHALIIVRFQRDKVDPQFVSHYINSEIGQARLRGLAVGSSLPHINTSELGRFKLPLPDFGEQRQIGEMLSLWETGIEKTKQFIAAKKKYLGCLREHSLARPAVATRTKLKAATHESTARNGKYLGRDAIMAVTKSVGMRPMREETIAASIDRYKLVRPKAFAYNPMRLNIGSIAMSNFDRDVLVSPDYVVFECDESKLLPGYLEYLRHTRLWGRHFEAAGSGGVRIRIYYDDLGAFAFPLPPLAQQLQVLAALDAAKAEIQTLESYLAALKLQKRGLMQKLLTGQWRVKLPEMEQA